MSNRFKLLDTFSDFQSFWKSASSMPPDEQISMWKNAYMSKYPELLKKQIKSYEDDNEDWKEIAGKVIPHYPERLPIMKKARSNIVTTGESICTHAAEVLKFDFNILLVVYVGIGCGAGWAARYDGRPAVLLGLENIAQEEWHSTEKLRGLISHEIGHLVHMNWRSSWNSHERDERDPLFLLYSEGFAQRCEHLIAGKDTWHMAPDKNWLAWCRDNKQWLKQELKTGLTNRVRIREFFGSWYEIRGYKQTGYYLGHEFIKELTKSYNLRETAFLSLEDIKKLAYQWLQS